MGAASQRHATIAMKKQTRRWRHDCVRLRVCGARSAHRSFYIDSFSAREPEMYGMALASAAPPACLPYGRAGWCVWT